MKKFLDDVAAVLETREISLDARFREVEAWCSLMAFGLLVMMENDYKAPVTIDRLREMQTVRDLAREAVAALAARLFGVPREKMDGAAYGTIPEWDSVNHLRLVMEAEARFGVKYPLESIPGMTTIDDFVVC